MTASHRAHRHQLYDLEPWQPLTITGIQHPYPGKLVVIEGVDGAGKTTLLTRLHQHLQAHGEASRMLRVPTNDLRAYLPWKAWYDESLGIPPEHQDGFGLSVMALGDRLVNQAMHVIPALEKGEWVLCDRYWLTSLAFEATPVQQYVLSKLIRPDLAILLDVDAPTVLERLKQRKDEAFHSREEAEKPRLVDRYRQIGPLNGYLMVDSGTCTPDQSFKAILNLLQEHWPSIELKKENP